MLRTLTTSRAVTDMISVLVTSPFQAFSESAYGQLGTCDQTFPGCNTAFLTCMVNRCDTLYPGGGLQALQHYACTKGAQFYGWAVTTDKAAEAFTTATEESCDCKCTDTKLTVCNEKCVDLTSDPENCGQCSFHVRTVPFQSLSPTLCMEALCS
jgi:hypothetical protein